MKDSAEITRLLLACKKNNAKAQLEIYNRYYKAMYNTVYRIVNQPDDAEDVMQEAFIKAFDKLHSFKGNSTFGAWLKRIVVNESLTWIRRNKSDKYVDIEKVNLPELKESDFDDAIDKCRIEQILQSIMQLNDKHRIAMSLHFIEGYDYEEIGEIMHVSYANVRTIISRAKTKIREKLNVNVS